jgi:hypothetical protein
MKRWLWLILATGLLLRLPGMFWGVAPSGGFDEFQPDEAQHVGIAMRILTQIAPGIPLEERFQDEWNAPAMGAHIAVPGALAVKADLSTTWLFGIARLVSLLYGLATILLVWFMARTLVRDDGAALAAAAAMAVFDLHITYSHMGVPETAYVFWSFAAVYWLALLLGEPERTPRWHWLLAGVSVASALALTLRFHVVVPAIVVVTLLLSVRTRRAHVFVLGGLMLAGAFYISSGFDYSVADGLQSLRVLASQNRDGIPQDHHLLWNPLLYALAITAGTSLPATVLAALGGVRAARRAGPGRRLLFLTLALAGLTFLLFWIGDGTFVRRATIFLPFVALLIGYGYLWLRDRYTPRTARIAVVLVLAYTGALAATSQGRFVIETRYQAADFIRDRYPDTDIAYSFYLPAGDMPPGPNLMDALQTDSLPDVLVLHEARYARYWKFFTTPFGVPECCDGVYHCVPVECRFTQRLLRGETDYHLVARFRHAQVFPERVLFARWFGSYEDLLGEVRVYERSDVTDGVGTPPLPAS